MTIAVSPIKDMTAEVNVYRSLLGMCKVRVRPNPKFSIPVHLYLSVDNFYIHTLYGDSLRIMI